MPSSMSSYRAKRRAPKRLLVLLVVLLAAAAYTGLRRGPAPTITLTPSLPAVGPSTEIRVEIVEKVRGLSSFRVLAVQESESELLAEEHRPRPSWAPWRRVPVEREARVQVGAEHQSGLEEGSLRLRVETSRAGTWLLPPRPVVQELELPVRLSPPSLRLVSEQSVVRQGGSGAVVYSAGDNAVRHGVRVGELEISGHALPTRPGADSPATSFFALYGVPHELDEASQIVLFAVDELGNRAEREFLSRFDRRRFTRDDIRLSDGFLGDVVPEIFAQTPGLESSGDLLADYLEVNRDLRRSNAEELRRLSASSLPQRLWQGAFEQLPSSRVMAVYGDHRTYFYGDEAVDEQTHLGHDLASVRRAPVPASNAGAVAWTGYFGIYGNTVVLDHGYGLMTVYSHLSEVTVESGGKVEKGQVLGRTGATGLAGGDHLHFTVLVGGVMVEPLEWWDRRWLESRIFAPLGEAFAIGD